MTSQTSFPVPSSRARRPGRAVSEPDQGVLIHPQAFLDVALRESPGRQVNTPGAGAQAADRGVIQADAQRLTHVVHGSTR